MEFILQEHNINEHLFGGEISTTQQNYPIFSLRFI